jgi:hypothetical protein
MKLNENWEQTTSYVIKLEGCDDENTTRIDLSPDELKIVKQIAKQLNANSETDCQPTMTINLFP